MHVFVQERRRGKNRLERRNQLSLYQTTCLHETIVWDIDPVEVLACNGEVEVEVGTRRPRDEGSNRKHNLNEGFML